MTLGVFVRVKWVRKSNRIWERINDCQPPLHLSHPCRPVDTRSQDLSLQSPSMESLFWAWRVRRGLSNRLDCLLIQLCRGGGPFIIYCERPLCLHQTPDQIPLFLTHRTLKITQRHTDTHTHTHTHTDLVWTHSQKKWIVFLKIFLNVKGNVRTSCVCCNCRDFVCACVCVFKSLLLGGVKTKTLITATSGEP